MSRLIKIIDSHIHLDQYEDVEIKAILDKESSIEALITVSMNLQSCQRNLSLAEKYACVKPAFGYHPEQLLPSETELCELLDWMEVHKDKVAAIGEVGLPFFMRAEKKVTPSEYDRYIELLEIFIKFAKKLDKPIALHAVYSDAPVVCDLLEKHSFSKAHFHWYKGDQKTTERMIENGYFASVTPEVVYDEEESVNLVQTFPLNQLLLETDGPWPFEGPFTGQRTNPKMIKESLRKIADLKRMNFHEIVQQTLQNAKIFYNI